MKHQDTDKYFKSHDRGYILRLSHEELAELVIDLMKMNYGKEKAIELVTSVYKPSKDLKPLVEKALKRK